MDNGARLCDINESIVPNFTGTGQVFTDYDPKQGYQPMTAVGAGEFSVKLSLAGLVEVGYSRSISQFSGFLEGRYEPNTNAYHGSWHKFDKDLPILGDKCDSHGVNYSSGIEYAWSPGSAPGQNPNRPGLRSYSFSRHFDYEV